MRKLAQRHINTCTCLSYPRSTQLHARISHRLNAKLTPDFRRSLRLSPPPLYEDVNANNIRRIVQFKGDMSRNWISLPPYRHSLRPKTILDVEIQRRANSQRRYVGDFSSLEICISKLCFCQLLRQKQCILWASGIKTTRNSVGCASATAQAQLIMIIKYYPPMRRDDCIRSRLSVCLSVCNALTVESLSLYQVRFGMLVDLRDI